MVKRTHIVIGNSYANGSIAVYNADYGNRVWQSMNIVFCSLGTGKSGVQALLAGWVKLSRRHGGHAHAMNEIRKPTVWAQKRSLPMV